MANMNICDYSFLVGIRSLYGVEIKPDLQYFLPLPLGGNLH